MTTIAEERKAKQDLVLAKWAEHKERAKAEGKGANQAAFVAASAGTDWETNISSLRNWIGLNKPRTAGTFGGAHWEAAKAAKAAAKAAASKSSFSVEIDLEEEFNKMYEEQRPAAFLQFLKDKSDSIRAKVMEETNRRIEAEIAKLSPTEKDS